MRSVIFNKSSRSGQPKVFCKVDTFWQYLYESICIRICFLIKVQVPHFKIVMCWGIWSYLHNLKDVKNTHGEVLFLVKLQASAYNFTKSNTWSSLFFTFFILYKWYQIPQNISSVLIPHILTYFTQMFYFNNPL